MAREVALLTYPIGVFRRRSDPQTPDNDAQPAAGSTTDPGRQQAEDDAGQPSTKGRPTPKRSEAEKARKERVRPPLTKREAMRKERERVRNERARSRQAMASGDERYFLARDQGPDRKFLRDYIDSRRGVGEFFLPIILIVLFANFIPVQRVQLLMMTIWLVIMILLFVDMTLLGIRVKRELRKRFPDVERRGQTFYALMRAMQIRRLRLPKPTVKPGDLV